MIDSKEALKQIKNHLYAILKEEAPELIHHYNNKFAIVEKDLEVLEILKLYLQRSRKGEVVTFDFVTIWLESEIDKDKIYNLINEWWER